MAALSFDKMTYIFKNAPKSELAKRGPSLHVLALTSISELLTVRLQTGWMK